MLVHFYRLFLGVSHLSLFFSFLYDSSILKIEQTPGIFFNHKIKDTLKGPAVNSEI